MPRSEIGSRKRRLSVGSVVPIEALLPRNSGICWSGEKACHTTLPPFTFNAPWFWKPRPLMVTTSRSIVMLPLSWSVAPLATTVPSGPSLAVVITTTVAPVVVAVMIGRFKSASEPPKFTVKTAPPGAFEVPAFVTDTVPPIPPIEVSAKSACSTTAAESENSRAEVV